MTRNELLVKLHTHPFDLLIIGGGIVGAGIARDAAMRGLSVSLIEQGDFAGETSSKTSKLIHGGLRYLEHGQLSLVFESLRERTVLRRIAPELVHPLSLLLPVYRGDTRPAWKVGVGLWLYDLLAAGHRISRPQMLSARRALSCEPRLAGKGLRAAGWYTDCRMDDARLCLANVLQAIEFGAVCVNYLTLRAFLKADGRLCGGVAEDRFTGTSCEIQARVVINATGPWADTVRRLSDPATPARLAPTKGIHLILPRVAEQALCFQARSDRRLLFLLPWEEDYSLMGTTETPVTAPLESLTAEADDIGYLLKELHRALPRCRRINAEHVVASFAGARPLLAFTGSAAAASREHRIEADQFGLVSVMGGKFTTYRRMAQQAVDFVMRQHRLRGDRCLTDQVRLVEDVAQPIGLDRWREVTRRGDEERLARLLIRYGASAFHILQLTANDPALAHPVCPHHDIIEAELVHSLQRELACTITDLLARRTRLAWSSCQGLDALSTVIDLFQRYTPFTDHQLEVQAYDYHRFLERGLAFRSARRTSSSVV